MSKRKAPLPQLSEPLTHLAARIFDTSDPPVSANRAALLAGIRRQTLYLYLHRRALTRKKRCPHCQQLLPQFHGDPETRA